MLTKFPPVARSSSPHPIANNVALSGVILNDNFPDLSNDNNANSTCASSTTNLFNDFIDNQDLADFNSNTGEYGFCFRLSLSWFVAWKLLLFSCLLGGVVYRCACYELVKR